MSWKVAPDHGSPGPVLLTAVQSISKRKEWDIQGAALKPHEVRQILKRSAREYSSICFLLKSQYWGVGRVDNYDSGSQHRQTEAPDGEYYLVVQARPASEGHQEHITDLSPGNEKI